jgi:NAD/NADP transhydrogenase beta subunit
VALVIGANDVVNPAARATLEPHLRHAHLDVDRAKGVIVLKRSMNRIRRNREPPLYAPNTP